MMHIEILNMSNAQSLVRGGWRGIILLCTSLDIIIYKQSEGSADSSHTGDGMVLLLDGNSKLDAQVISGI